MGAGIGEIAGLIGQGVDSQFKMGTGLLQGLTGAIALKKLNKNRPQYQVSPDILYNQQLAQQWASQGLPQASINAYQSGINQNQASGINAIERTGQGLNLISMLKGQNDNQFLKLLAMDAEARMANVDKLYGANTAVANEKRQAWDYNVNLPFQQKYNQAVNLTNSGMQNVNSAFDQNANAAAASGGGTWNWNAPATNGGNWNNAGTDLGYGSGYNV